MVYRFQDFELSPAQASLRRGGEEVGIRRKGFQVLLALVERRDRVVSKEELFAIVWADTAVTDDVLAGVISELRRALGETPKSPAFIKTVSRAGYRFVAEVEEVEAEPEPAVQPEAVIAAPPAPPPPTNRLRQIGLAAAMIVAVVGAALVLRGMRMGGHAPDESDAQETAWWRFDERSGDQVLDATGNGNVGRLTGGASRVPGKSGMALAFDGRTGWVEGSDPAHMLPSNDASRTVTAWLRTTSTNGDTTQILTYGARELPRQFQGTKAMGGFSATLRLDGRLEMGIDLPGRGIHGRTRLDDGNWHHVAAAWKGPASRSEGRLYVDGREEGAGRVGPFATIPGAPWSMASAGGGTFFRGQLDDVRVFNAALSAEQVNALYRCSSGSADLSIDGQSYFLLPIWGGADIQPDGEIRNNRKDTGGVQFARVKDNCSLDSLRGGDAGQDLHIVMDVLVPSDAAGHIVEAGPYFRSRRAAPGDGVIGGTSAGYWLVLFSSGMVTVQRLNPGAVVAFAQLPHFDAAIFHHLEMAAVGERLQVAVDGTLVQFDQGGQSTSTVSIPSLWNGPPVVGYNRGTAGIAFWARQNRGELGGQRIRGMRVEHAATLLKP